MNIYLRLVIYFAVVVWTYFVYHFGLFRAKEIVKREKAKKKDPAPQIPIEQTPLSDFLNRNDIDYTIWNGAGIRRKEIHVSMKFAIGDTSMKKDFQGADFGAVVLQAKNWYDKHCATIKELSNEAKNK